MMQTEIIRVEVDSLLFTVEVDFYPPTPAHITADPVDSEPEQPGTLISAHVIGCYILNAYDDYELPEYVAEDLGNHLETELYEAIAEETGLELW